MKRYTALLAALACLLALACAGCAHYGNRLPETSPQSDGASKTPEAPIGVPAPAAEEKKNDTRAAYAAYLGALTAAREDVLAYNWQKGMVYDEDLYRTRPAAPAKQVALADVWGDETPELFFITAMEKESYHYAAKLRVFTWEENGGLRELLSESVDSKVGGGSGYRLFQCGTDKGLWLYNISYGESSSEKYVHFSSEGAMRPLLECIHNHYPDYSNDGEDAEMDWVDSYTRDGEPCTKEAYEQALPAEGEQAKGLLMRNAFYYEYDKEADKPEDAFDWPADGAAMECDEALAYLRRELGVECRALDEKEFFASLPGGFTFCSGVGGWSSELYLKPDGTFEGNYHDSDMGDDGEDYPYGTIYICTFTGAFGDVKRVDEYTYSMRLKKLDVEPTPAEEWIDDGIRYVSSVPYGLENADEVLVYLPGAQVQSLPNDFTDWIGMPLAWNWDEAPVTLPFYGLYNLADKEGWYSYDGSY